MKRQQKEAAVSEASKANHPSSSGQEKDAAVPEVSSVNPPPATSSPAEPGQSTKFVFAEPSLENVSADSNFANMNVDGNATISHPEVKRPSEQLFGRFLRLNLRRLRYRLSHLNLLVIGNCGSHIVNGLRPTLKKSM